MENEYTFLTEDQIFNDTIEVIEKRGTKATITDFSIILGGHHHHYYHHRDYYNYGGQEETLKGGTGWYWTKSDNGNGKVYVVDGNGDRNVGTANMRIGGARPVIQFSSIDNIPTNGLPARRSDDGILEIEYGYYPQQAVSNELKGRLESAYQNNEIRKTGNSYTTDSVWIFDGRDVSQPFQPQKHKEYEYERKEICACFESKL